MEDLAQYLAEHERKLDDENQQREWEAEQREDDSRCLPDPEYLGVVDISGTMHAGFPSARRTLCQLEPNETTGFWALSPYRETLHPDCRICLRVIRSWMDEVVVGYEISGIPRSWQAAYMKARIDRGGGR